MPFYIGKKIVGNTAQVIDRVGKKVLEDDYIISPTREDPTKPTLEQYDTYEGPYVDDLGNEYDGVDTIKVRKVGSWIDSEISADNIRKGHSILGVAGQVVELLPQEISVKSTTSKREIIPTGGKTGITKVIVEPMTYEQKTVSPSKNEVNVYTSAGYDAMSKVTVSAVTSSIDSNIKPENIKKDVKILGVTGTLEQTEGEADPVLEQLDITPKTRTQTFTPETGVDGYSKVNVAAVTSAIDTNIVPKNIKRGVTILGVDGDYVLENLQSKVAAPSLSTQVVTYDDDKYEGLSSVIIQPVTSAIDTDIKPENIKAGVDILGVTGEYEGETYDIEPAVNVNAKTTPVVVKPSEGYDYLSQVNIAGVTAAIDPNILAENIKKNIEILGVMGTLEEQKYYFKDSVRVTAGTNETIIKPGDGYDALLEVIVEAVTASIDPNILPKNIKKNISILGVTGTLEEGDKQKWFDFEGSQGIAPLGNVVMGGGSEWHTEKPLIDNDDELFDNWFENKQGAIENIGAALFTIVNGYDDEASVDPTLYQTYIYFQGGNYYKDYSTFVKIPDRVCHLYAFDNEFSVDGCLLNCEDSSEEKTYSMYLLNSDNPRAVLVDGTMSEALLPEGYENYIYIREITIPAHKVFVPRYDSNNFRLNWILRDEKNITHTSQENGIIMPVTLNISASDINYGEDEELEVINEEHINYTTTSTAPTITDGIASEFNSSKYIIYEPQAGNVDYLEVTCRAYVVGGGTYNIFFNNENKGFGVYGSTSERYWRIWSGSANYSPLYNFTNNNWYWCKLIQEYNTTKLLTMLDDGTYTEIYQLPQKTSNKWTTSISLNFKLFSTMNRLYIGNGYNTLSEYWRGKIDLNNFEFNINNQKYYPYQKIDIVKSNHNITPLSENLLFYKGECGFWDGQNYEVKQGSLLNYEDDGSAVEMPVYVARTGELKYKGNYTAVGNVVLDEKTSQLDGLAASSYAKINTINLNNASTWEMNFKIRTSDDVTTNQKIFHTCSGTGDPGRYGLCIAILNGEFYFFASSNNSSWMVDKGSDEINLGAALPNTTYYLKMTFDGSKYELYYSFDGETYYINDTYESSAKVCECKNTYLGIYSAGSFKQPLLGSMYLKDCNIIIDGEEVWRGADEEYLDKGLNYILSPIDSFEGMISYGQIGTVMIPEHKLIEWNGEKYEEYKLITLEVNDEDTTIYAEVN